LETKHKQEKRASDYLLAAAVLLVIFGILYLLLGNIGNGPPEVGVVTVTSGGVSGSPLGNEIYTTEGDKKTEKKRLVPEEVGEQAPTFPYSDDITVNYDGKSENGAFYFTQYQEVDGALEVVADRKTFFTPLEDPGTYLVCIETYWGTEENNIGTEYYFWLTVS
jgi:hypothetical protein